MYAKWKFLPRSRKWMTCLGGVAIVVFCILLFLNRTESPEVRPVTAARVTIGPSANELPEVVRNQPSKYAFRYRLNEEQICHGWRNGSDDSGPFLLIFVSSAPDHAERRLAIRRTWANRRDVSRWSVVVIFLIGAPSGRDGQPLLDDESFGYHDIVQGDFIDSYRNLSIKSIVGLNWTREFCAGAEYVMKTDDDVYINVKLLVDFLRAQGRRRWIGGCIKQSRAPAPFDRHGVQVPMVIGHPPFVAGAGYVLSGDIVADLYQVALRKTLVPVEDAFITAYCAQDIGIRPSHYDGFNCGEPVFDDCHMRYKFVGHHVNPQRQSQIWNALHSKDSTC